MCSGVRCPFGWDDFAAVRSADRADEGDIAQLQREPLRAPLSRETFGALGP
jgi:hypothetical protein